MNDGPRHPELAKPGSLDAPASGAASSASSFPSGSGGGTSAADAPTRISDTPPNTDTSIPLPYIEGYAILGEVHRGGQGVVYKAVQLGAKRTVALKVLLEGPYASEAARRRFEREIELAASLRHENIVTILESGVSHGRYYFAMDFVDGVRLDQYLRRMRPPLRVALGLFERICDAVNFAHQRGVIHRDLKPSNILVDGDGKPHVLDFGLAKTASEPDPDRTAAAAVSSTGQVIGTLAYMSPEQAAGSTDIDVRTDVYSLGVVFYEALLGTPPYPVDGPLGEVLRRIANDDPVPPRAARNTSRFGRQIDDELETVLLKCLEKDRARRYQSAGALGADLRHYLAGEPIEAKRASGLYVLRKTLKRYRWQFGAAGVLLLMLVAFLISFAVLYHREAESRRLADKLRGEAALKAQQAEIAEARERSARKLSEQNEERAMQAAAAARDSLIQQRVQRGDFELLRGDLATARDSYWGALLDAPGDPRALWALRHYFMATVEDQAVQLAYRLEAKLALSNDLRYAAVSEEPRSLALRDTATGALLSWHSTPEGLAALTVDNQGRMAAVGATWLRVWWPGESVPRIATTLPGGLAPLGVFLVGDLAVAVVDPRQVRSYRFSDGQQVAWADLPRAPSGVMDADETRLVVPTPDGLEVFTFRPGGKMDWERAWSVQAGVAPRAACLFGANALAVLGDALYLRTSAEPASAWRKALDLKQPGLSVDLTPGGDRILVRRAEGVDLYEGGVLTRSWSEGQQALREARLSPDGRAVITLDQRGALTRWPTGSTPVQQRIHGRPLQSSAIASSGASAAFVDVDGRIFAYSPGREPALEQIDLPSVLGILGGRKPEDLRLSVRADGGSVAVYYADRIWLRELDRPRPVAIRWNSDEAPVIKAVALGERDDLLAVHAQSVAGARQVISFHRAQGRRRGQTARNALVNLGDPIELDGALVREIAFIPGRDDLLVTRSNGEALIIPSDPDKRAAQPLEPWIRLDAAPGPMSLTRSGSAVAIACEDGMVRVLSLERAATLSAVRIGRVASLAFSPDGETLLARGEEGVISLYSVASGQRLAGWEEAGGPRPMAGWVGEDTLLISTDGPLLATDLGDVDERIESGRVAAVARDVQRQIVARDFQPAVEAATNLAPAQQQAIRMEALLGALRGARGNWVEPLAREAFASADAPMTLRAAHAAYAGERFELSRELFQRLGERTDRPLDAYSTWRWLECEFLLGDPGKVADGLDALLARRDLDPRDASRVRIERIAALVFAGRRGEAREHLGWFSGAEAQGRGVDPISLWSANHIGGRLLGEVDDVRYAEQLASLVRLFEDAWLRQREDVDFFDGEMALRSGDVERARQAYQRCLDLARDEWPANWARYRLSKLAAPGGSAEE